MCVEVIDLNQFSAGFEFIAESGGERDVRL